MIRIGLYTPTPKGWVSQRTAHTTLQDSWWCMRHAYETIDMAAHVAPGNSIEVGRNTAVARAITAGCTHLRMLDADVSAPWGESLLAQLWRGLHEHEATAAGALVEVHGGKAGKLNAYPVVESPAYVAQYVSAAAMLIDLRRLGAWPAKQPYFARGYNAAMTQCLRDEGYAFSQGIRALGGTVVACKVPTHHASPSGR